MLITKIIIERTKMKKYILILFITSLPLFGETPVITVSIPPQSYFIHRIAGDQTFDVNIMIPNGQSPAVYSPNPSQIRRMTMSAGFFLVGHPAFIFEKKHINPYLSKQNKNTISLYNSVKNAGLSIDDSDPHIWMSPEFMKITAIQLYDFLKEFYPEDSLSFKDNLTYLIREIETLQTKTAKLLKEHQVKQFIIYHPAWGYYAAEFNLEQIAIESHGHEPGPRHLSHITDHAHTHGENKIFIQRGFSQKSAEAIARETESEILEADPLEYDWIKTLNTMTQNLIGHL